MFARQEYIGFSVFKICYPSPQHHAYWSFALERLHGLQILADNFRAKTTLSSSYYRSIRFLLENISDRMMCWFLCEVNLIFFKLPFGFAHFLPNPNSIQCTLIAVAFYLAPAQSIAGMICMIKLFTLGLCIPTQAIDFLAFCGSLFFLRSNFRIFILLNEKFGIG